MKTYIFAIFAIALLGPATAMSRPPLDRRALLEIVSVARRLQVFGPPICLPTLFHNRTFFSWARNQISQIGQTIKAHHNSSHTEAPINAALEEQIHFFSEKLAPHRQFLTKLGFALGSDGYGACSDENIEVLIDAHSPFVIEKGFFMNKCDTRKFEQRRCEDPFGTIVRYSHKYAEERLQQKLEGWHVLELREKRILIKQELRDIATEFGKIGAEMNRSFILNTVRLAHQSEPLTLLEKEAETVFMICMGIKAIIYLHLYGLA